MKKIAVVTATRAEYGLLSPVICELRKHESDGFRVELIVTGTHLSEAYGTTVAKIEERIDHRIPVSVRSGSETDISANQAEFLIKFTGLFMKENYNAVVLLGDRYEMLAIAVAAGNTRTPVFHLCGGDTTEGAMDDWIRHSITKISYLHFVTKEESKKRVIQLGDAPGRVFNYGSTSIDNILRLSDMSRAEALASVGLGVCKFALCTYHPVTMEDGEIDGRISEFLEALKAFPEIEFIVTKSNADQGGARINELFDEAGGRIPNLHVFASLGVRRYLSLMKYSEFVLGNSSSGIIETPAFRIPTVNIGDRQKGRLSSRSIINCGSGRKEIMAAIKVALSDEHKATCRDIVSPYGDGSAAQKISRKMIDTIMGGRMDLKKKFYDL